MQHTLYVNSSQLDSESYQIAIDNCCLFSITKHRRDFTGELKPCKMKIQGFTGSSTVKWKGTWRLRIEDNDGIKQLIEIPNTMYCKATPYHLLLPQHWSQQRNDLPGTYCKDGHDWMELVWDGGKLKRSVKLDPRSNCGFIRSTPGYDKFNRFITMNNTNSPNAAEYHADNGRFANNTFVNDARTQKQRVT